MFDSQFVRTLCSFALVTLLVFALAGPVSGHRSGCHRHHTCPSDHATYRWHGLFCEKPSADERTSAFKKQVRYGGRTYYCKR